MNRDVLQQLSKDDLIALVLAQARQIEALTKRIDELEAKLGLPPKTPDNSSRPPSQGHKRNGESKTKPKGKAHAGTHRPLHPNPTRRREVLAEHCPYCRTDLFGVAQSAVQAYDRIEIPEVAPDITRVTLFGGTCPCCAKRFKADAPAGLEPGSPFGLNLRAGDPIRALGAPAARPVRLGDQ